MSRELEFRAWVKPLKRYANAIDTIFYHKECDAEGGGIWSVVCEEWDIEVYECDNIVIEQYTGLKDKNGKEIYEGDIVFCKDCDEYHEITWVDNCASFHGWRSDKAPCIFFGESYETIYYEVVGNIHENPELLEDEYDN